MAKDQTFTHTSTRTAGNDPIEGVDPGGTHSTKPGQPDKTQSKPAEPAAEQNVQRGDRNPERESRTPQPKGL
jgi:hypothetical protein